ncbi:MULTISPECIES: cell division protein ZapA [Novosphingobium]|jgi:cell division protein ZapA|uniref:Cell division protein ZapA n=1 Tax=Novosphingobium panipatense TaxID=428991 RepID=A0ABY1QLD9_9SPHN|nr:MULTISPECIES: cell division protein ZapA [Novosphingobium]SMP74644.1 cell division protein ZapA [Novosphingobium panipatense]
MGNVTLSIGSREFTLACSDGEEGHIRRLGEVVDAKVAAAGAVGQTESRMLLFAALMLADELHELRVRPAVSAIPDEVGERLAALAARVENLADLLESDAPNA